MFTPAIGDMILRGSIDGAVMVLDASNRSPVAGPLTLLDALAYARAHGATNVFQQTVDERGRVLGEPGLLAALKA